MTINSALMEVVTEQAALSLQELNIREEGWQEMHVRFKKSEDGRQVHIGIAYYNDRADERAIKYPPTES